MCLTLFASIFSWFADKTRKLERRTHVIVTDPHVFISSGIASAVARAAIIPIDNGGTKGPFQAVYRRIPQWGIVLWVYVPLAKHLLPAKTFSPERKAWTTFYIACFAGLLMRIITNPINKARDEAVGSNFSAAATKIWREKGIQGFYNGQHPLIPNMFYFGITLTVFEGFRRYFDYKGYIPQDSVVGNAAWNGAVATGASAFGSTIMYPLSRMRYEGSVTRLDSVINRSWRATVLKEAPMTGLVFFGFSLLQPIFAPHHGKRCGFGY